MNDPKVPVDDWTNEELTAYKINIQEKTEAEFFDVPVEDAISPNISDAKVSNFLDHLHQAIQNVSTQPMEAQSITYNLIGNLLFSLGYTTPDVVVRTRETLWLRMCYEQVAIRADVTLVDSNSKLLLVVLASTLPRDVPSYPEAQIVAAALAAFQLNNNQRQRGQLVDQLDMEHYPAIIMVGALPVFYKVKITVDLNLGVQLGKTPNFETIVERYTPVCLREKASIGGLDMLSEEDKEKILQCYKAFRRFVLPSSGSSINPPVLTKGRGTG